jgi:hypothetical protein
MIATVRYIRLIRQVLTFWKQSRDPSGTREFIKDKLSHFGAVTSPESDRQQDWNKYISRLWKTQKELRTNLHGKERTRMRVQISAHTRRREEQREAGKVKQYLDKVLERTKGEILTVMTVEEDGKEVLLTDKGEVAKAAVEHFSKWMGQARDRWYIQQGCTMYQPGEEGEAIRRKIADQELLGEPVTEEDMERWGVPQELKPVLQQMRRKKTEDGRIATPDLFPDVMKEITNQEWKEYWRSKKKGTAPGKSGFSPAQVAYLHEEGLEHMRVLANTIIRTGRIGSDMCKEILIPIPKEAGNSSIHRLRPLKLHEILRKSVLGILMRRLTQGLTRHGLLNGMQFGFLEGKDTAQALFALRAITDHCNHHRQTFSILSQDISYQTCL